MRIDTNPGAQPLAENQAPSNAAAKGNAASNAGNPPSQDQLGTDQASLSGGHVQVQALVAHVLQLPEATQEKVQALREAVSSGKYRPDARGVAGALFSDLAVRLAA